MQDALSSYLEAFFILTCRDERRGVHVKKAPPEPAALSPKVGVFVGAKFRPPTLNHVKNSLSGDYSDILLISDGDSTSFR